DYVPEDTGSISGLEPPQSPDSSYSNSELGQEDFAKEPPIAPQHLNSTLLNVASPHMEIPAPYSRPPHVVLNHLYMHKNKSCPSVVALGSTSRYRSKYVTVVLYKAIQR
ncbi:5-AMP-activated protein kinase beta-2 subunit protein, partial [Striga hermonthica]